MLKFLSRISYLVTRTVVKPDRAFSAIASHAPLLDVALVVVIGAWWIGIWTALEHARDIFRMPPGAFVNHLAWAILGFIIALVILAVYGFAVSVTATLLGGKARLLPTILSFVLCGCIGFGVCVIPTTVIKFVDYGERMTPVSRSIISVGPWVYIAILLYFAVLKIHKTVAPRSIAYLGLAALPVVLICVFYYRYGPFVLPVGLG